MRSQSQLRTVLAARVRRHRTTIGLVLAVPGALALVLLVLGPVSWLIAGHTVRALNGKDQADALNAVRETVLASSGGVAVLLGLGYTARTYHLSRRGQVTQRFSTAVGQLASEKLESKLGGIYALEHVMAESAQEHATVVALLAAYVREHAQAPVPAGAELAVPAPRTAPGRGTEPATDIQAALTVLARRPERPEARRLDLRSTGLAGLILRSFDLGHPPRLSRAYLTWADLRKADLRGADLREAILNGADLSGAVLASAQLDQAQLAKASLRGAHLSGASLLGTDLRGADLTDAVSLTAEQLSGAVLDEHTVLPPELAGDPWVVARIEACRVWQERHGEQPADAPAPTARALL
ncbi:pentapeptide repeat-containing protein [Peterkaempfera griseoplana]|uniref:pentapeptide repeat-containing protein n=1 Tax=Peterkaempfera griseoplana TaxID=66896 RepID=UPI0006E22551|nr:pentapeptide repeat-containing protein [Peterkaempfera griseoplana]